MVRLTSTESKIEAKMLTALIFLCCIIPFGIGCSCGPFPSRSDAICQTYLSSTNVYRATINDIYCKCRANDTHFSCIEFTEDGGLVEGNVQSTYTCADDGQLPRPVSFIYDYCSNVTVKAGAGPVDPIVTPIQSVNCSTAFNTMLDEGSYAGCALHNQPCYYTVTVDQVFKGDYQVGQMVNTSGPDVVTSCGQYHRVLEVGTSYIVGIGSSACSPISDWTKVGDYQPNEIEMLSSLSNVTRCNSSISTTITNAMFLVILLMASCMLY